MKKVSCTYRSSTCQSIRSILEYTKSANPLFFSVSLFPFLFFLVSYRRGVFLFFSAVTVPTPPVGPSLPSRLL